MTVRTEAAEAAEAAVLRLECGRRGHEAARLALLELAEAVLDGEARWGGGRRVLPAADAGPAGAAALARAALLAVREARRFAKRQAQREAEFAAEIEAARAEGGAA